MPLDKQKYNDKLGVWFNWDKITAMWGKPKGSVFFNWQIGDNY